MYNLELYQMVLLLVLVLEKLPYTEAKRTIDNVDDPSGSMVSPTLVRKFISLDSKISVFLKLKSVVTMF